MRVLQARLLPPLGVLMGTTVGRTMVALLPPGDLRLAAAAAPARTTLSVLLTPPPALNAVGQPPAGGMVALFDAWGETRSPTEHEQLRTDLTAHVWSDRGELLAPYVVQSSSMVTHEGFFFPVGQGFFSLHILVHCVSL